MAGSSPHQASPHQAESATVHQQDDFLNLECKRDRENYQEGSVPQPLDSLLSMSMREGESVKAYSDRYWEMFNEIDGDFDDVDDVAIKSLTGKPVTSLRQLMDQVDKYKRIKDDQQQGKGKAKVILQERRIDIITIG